MLPVLEFWFRRFSGECWSVRVGFYSYGPLKHGIPPFQEFCVFPLLWKAHGSTGQGCPENVLMKTRNAARSWIFDIFLPLEDPRLFSLASFIHLPWIRRCFGSRYLGASSLHVFRHFPEDFVRPALRYPAGTLLSSVRCLLACVNRSALAMPRRRPTGSDAAQKAKSKETSSKHKRSASTRKHLVVRRPAASRVKRRPATDWLVRCSQLRDWLTRYPGRFPSRGARGKSELRLARWIKNQRAARLSLSEDQKNSLESLPQWSWVAHDWYERCRELAEWFKAHPGREPSRGAQSKDELQLARWVNNQRDAINQGTLSKEQEDALLDLDEWTDSALERALNRYDDSIDELNEETLSMEHAQCWPHRYHVVGAWLEKNSEYPKQNASDSEARRVARWINNQRVAHAKNLLTRDRTERLEKLPGWTWNIYHLAWEDHYEEAKYWFFGPPYSQQKPCPCYPAAHRDVLNEAGESVDKRTPEEKADETALARWLDNQRQLRERGTLSDERIALLEKLPNWKWSTHVRGARREQERGWNIDCQEFQRTMPHGKVPSSGPLGQTKAQQYLARWFWRNLRLFKESNRPRRRLCFKQKVYYRMLPHRAEKFEKMLHAKGIWNSPWLGLASAGAPAMDNGVHTTTSQHSGTVGSLNIALDQHSGAVGNVCADCGKTSLEGDTDIEDNQWYCSQCWDAFESALQQDHHESGEGGEVNAPIEHTNIGVPNSVEAEGDVVHIRTAPCSSNPTASHPSCAPAVSVLARYPRESRPSTSRPEECSHCGGAHATTFCLRAASLAPAAPSLPSSASVQETPLSNPLCFSAVQD